MTYRIHQVSLLAVISLFLSACSSTNEVRVTEGFQERDATTVQTIAKGTPIIVHADESARLVTIRHGSSLPEDFLICIDHKGRESALLKALPLKGATNMRTAEILEGKPNVNDTVVQASPARSLELGKIYRDPDE
ncbi:MAG: hypothetical protein AAGC73_03920 [Verrucomicrobiota bacterium]